MKNIKLSKKVRTYERTYEKNEDIITLTKDGDVYIERDGKKRRIEVDRTIALLLNAVTNPRGPHQNITGHLWDLGIEETP